MWADIWAPHAHVAFKALTRRHLVLGIGSSVQFWMSRDRAPTTARKQTAHRAWIEAGFCCVLQVCANWGFNGGAGWFIWTRFLHRAFCGTFLKNIKALRMGTMDVFKAHNLQVRTSIGSE